MEFELQQRLLSTRAELQTVRARLATANQRKQLLEITKAHVRKEQSSDHVWQGVGRMFMSVSTAEHEKDCEDRVKEIDEQISSWQKKEQYFATTLEKMLLALKATE